MGRQRNVCYMADTLRTGSNMMSSEHKRQRTPRELAEHISANWGSYANPVDALEELIADRDGGCSRNPAILTSGELSEIRQRRAGMFFPDSNPTGLWLDIDRLLAHQEALRQALNARNQERIYFRIGGKPVEVFIDQDQGRQIAKGWTVKIDPSQAGMAFRTDATRRIRLDLMTPAELAIHDAMLAVEGAGADALLTEAINLLQQARDKVSDFVDRCESFK